MAATGIKYTNQVGGRACLHPEVEGYVIDIIDDDITDFPDCCYGCWRMHSENDDEKGSTSKQKRMNLLTDLNKLLANSFKCSKSFFDTSVIHSLQMDEDRFDELMEAWWPVKGYLHYLAYRSIEERLEGKRSEDILVPIKGYITLENCD